MNLENTKVYTTNEDVIRKYTELCGVEFYDNTSGFDGEILGVAFIADDGDEVGYFDDTSFCHHELENELTPEQINALYSEKFGGKPDQLDAHLSVDVKWKNGDECVYMTHNVVHQFIGPCPKREGYGYIQAPGFEVNFVELSKLSKPETQQREDRERLETIETMCNEIDRLPHGEAFAAMATLYDLGYRKEK